MVLSFDVSIRNAQADAITTRAGASSLLRVYDGTRPATAAAITTQVLLAELTGAAAFAPRPRWGWLTANAITQDSSANATGTASWFRHVQSNGTSFVQDGSVGVSGADLNLNTVSIVAGGVVAVTSCVITTGNA